MKHMDFIMTSRRDYGSEGGRKEHQVQKSQNSATPKHFQKNQVDKPISKVVHERLVPNLDVITLVDF
ncbi:hypothetical protein CDV31_001907 [Fusarium ambrosium]|uniref:Uncharacterized protein n=1 Tax=Fusarium ambrosium TaxID=131363 RepID=A0A428UY44_9HYPO|nr:hypothetical protein CDV31_001907 [Fusarium ambrosium]